MCPAARAGQQGRRDPVQGQPQGAAPDGKDFHEPHHTIESFAARLKQHPAIATLHDKRASHFLGAIHLAAAVVWLVRGHALTLQSHFFAPGVSVARRLSARVTGAVER